VVWFGASAFGWELAWELLAGKTPPTTKDAKGCAFQAWSISILGYLLVPSFIGLLVAGVTDIAMNSRLAPIESQIKVIERALEVKGPHENAPDTGHGGEGIR
jgi:hypothetical protein